MRRILCRLDRGPEDDHYHRGGEKSFFPKFVYICSVLDAGMTFHFQRVVLANYPRPNKKLNEFKLR